MMLIMRQSANAADERSGAAQKAHTSVSTPTHRHHRHRHIRSTARGEKKPWHARTYTFVIIGACLVLLFLAHGTFDTWPPPSHTPKNWDELQRAHEAELRMSGKKIDNSTWDAFRRNASKIRRDSNGRIIVGTGDDDDTSIMGALSRLRKRVATYFSANIPEDVDPEVRRLNELWLEREQKRQIIVPAVAPWVHRDLVPLYRVWKALFRELTYDRSLATAQNTTTNRPTIVVYDSHAGYLTVMLTHYLPDMYVFSVLFDSDAGLQQPNNVDEAELGQNINGGGGAGGARGQDGLSARASQRLKKRRYSQRKYKHDNMDAEETVELIGQQLQNMYVKDKIAAKPTATERVDKRQKEQQKGKRPQPSQFRRNIVVCVSSAPIPHLMLPDVEKNPTLTTAAVSAGAVAGNDDLHASLAIPTAPFIPDRLAPINGSRSDYQLVFSNTLFYMRRRLRTRTDFLHFIASLFLRTSVATFISLPLIPDAQLNSFKCAKERKVSQETTSNAVLHSSESFALDTTTTRGNTTAPPSSNPSRKRINCTTLVHTSLWYTQLMTWYRIPPPTPSDGKNGAIDAILPTNEPNTNVSDVPKSVQRPWYDGVPVYGDAQGVLMDAARYAGVRITVELLSNMTWMHSSSGLYRVDVVSDVGSSSGSTTAPKSVSEAAAAGRTTHGKLRDCLLRQRHLSCQLHRAELFSTCPTEGNNTAL